MFFAISYCSVVHFTDIRTYAVFVISCHLSLALFTCIRFFAVCVEMCSSHFTRCTDKLIYIYYIIDDQLKKYFTEPGEDCYKCVLQLIVLCLLLSLSSR